MTGFHRGYQFKDLKGVGGEVEHLNKTPITALGQLNGGRDGELPETVDSHLETKMNYKKTGEPLIPERLVQPSNFLAIQLFTYGKGNGRNVTYQQKTLNILIKGCTHRSGM
jgi:hypothetical protein